MQSYEWRSVALMRRDAQNLLRLPLFQGCTGCTPAECTVRCLQEVEQRPPVHGAQGLGELWNPLPQARLKLPCREPIAAFGLLQSNAAAFVDPGLDRRPGRANETGSFVRRDDVRGSKPSIASRQAAGEQLSRSSNACIGALIAPPVRRCAGSA